MEQLSLKGKLRKKLNKIEFNFEEEIPDSLINECLSITQTHLIKNFDKLDISLGDYQKHVRLNVEMPVGGL